jgi:hypothetical protein
MCFLHNSTGLVVPFFQSLWAAVICSFFLRPGRLTGLMTCRNAMSIFWRNRRSGEGPKQTSAAAAASLAILLACHVRNCADWRNYAGLPTLLSRWKVCWQRNERQVWTPTVLILWDSLTPFQLVNSVSGKLPCRTRFHNRWPARCSLARRARGRSVQRDRAIRNPAQFRRAGP